MGARQSKRSVDISSTPKKGELENGTVTATEEKLEKIGEGDCAATKVNANGSTTTTSTVTAEQQETAAATSPAEAGDAPSTKTEITTEQAEKAADVSTTSVDEKPEEPSSPASPSETTEESGSEKKKKTKKHKWSFRSFSFSKKDKVKPTPKEEKQETVPEGNENTQSEQATTEATNAPAVQSEEPPPLPTSPPPTPADETAEKEEPKEETPTISEGDVDASGGGEGLAEPIEDGELEESTTVAAAVPEVTAAPAAPASTAVEQPLTNGVAAQNGDYKETNGKFTEDDELISPVHERKPSVDSVTVKIGSLKLQITSENAEQPAQNGVADETAPVELNGLKESDVPTTEKAVEN